MLKFRGRKAVQVMKRPASRRKKKHKGVQCRRGQPLYYGEKKQHCNLMLTPTALDKLEELALSSNNSRSEVIEQWLRSQMQKDFNKESGTTLGRLD